MFLKIFIALAPYIGALTLIATKWNKIKFNNWYKFNDSKKVSVVSSIFNWHYKIIIQTKLYNHNSNLDCNFKLKEREIRERGYNMALKRELKDRTFKVDESFLNDSDLKSEFMLHLFWLKSIWSDEKYLIYSARSFSDQDEISDELLGEKGYFEFITTRQKHKNHKLIPEHILLTEPNSNLCIDRFSSNLSVRYLTMLTKNKFDVKKSQAYFFRHILNVNKDCKKIFALARSSRSDTLLSKYISLGMKKIGYNYYTINNSPLKHHCLSANIYDLKSYFETMHKVSSAIKFPKN